jgi:hypothetical protein
MQSYNNYLIYANIYSKNNEINENTMETDNVNTTSQNEDTITFMGLKIKKSDYDKFFNQKNEKQDVKPLNLFELLQEKMKNVKIVKKPE